MADDTIVKLQEIADEAQKALDLYDSTQAFNAANQIIVRRSKVDAVTKAQSAIIAAQTPKP